MSADQQTRDVVAAINENTKSIKDFSIAVAVTGLAIVVAIFVAVVIIEQGVISAS